MSAAGAPAGFASRWRTVSGLRLHALESASGAADGNGGPAVLLPGLVTASRSMVPLGRALAARGVPVRILDPPGFGYSDKPRRSLTIPEQADLIARWLVMAGRRPARLLGNSFGTQVAAAVAAGHPGTVGRLVLLSPTVAPPLRRRLSWLRAWPARSRGGPEPVGRWRAGLLGRLHAALGDGAPLRVLNIAEYCCAGLPRAAGTLRSAVAGHPIEQALPHTGAPTLVIRADRDPLSSLEWAGQLARLAPDGRLARLPGVSHDAFYQAPDAVAEVAVPHLKGGPQSW